MKWINDSNRKWWTLGTVCFTLLMIVLDGNVVNLAVPSIMKSFGAEFSQMEWVNNAYLLTFAIFLITFGRLGDELGRKKLFAAGLIAFIVGSALCAFAKNIDQLIIYRVVQGIGGAAMMPATLSLIAANFEKKERGTAMGLWGAVSGLGIVLGPILGGYLTDKGMSSAINSFLHISEYWRYVFLINIPIGIIAILATIFIVRESRDSEQTHKFDIPGIVVSSLAILSLTFAFIEGTKYGWWQVNETLKLFGHSIAVNNISIIPFLFLIFIFLVILFVIIEKNCKQDPLVDMKLFTARNFSVGTFAAGVLSFAMMGSFFLLPLFLQVVMGFSPIKTGQVLLPFAFTILLISPLSGRLADKIGGKPLVILGMAIMAVGGYYIGHFRIDTEIRDLVLPFIVMGLGMGLSMPPLTNITILETPENEIGGASGVLSTARQIGSVMGIAILGAVLQTNLTSNISTNIEKISEISPQVKSQIIDSAKSQNFGTVDTQKELIGSQEGIIKSNAAMAEAARKNMSPAQQEQFDKAQANEQEFRAKAFQALGQKIGNAVKQSFVDSINFTFRVAALVALLGALFSFLFKGQKLFKKSPKSS
jgi:EmrB/QacA subfamily drug resistance transporter